MPDEKQVDPVIDAAYAREVTRFAKASIDGYLSAAERLIMLGANDGKYSAIIFPMVFGSGPAHELDVYARRVAAVLKKRGFSIEQPFPSPTYFVASWYEPRPAK